jgi:hypothetical protein
MRKLLAMAILWVIQGAAWADDRGVKPQSTVEVLDDKAQVDDVISRLRAHEEAAKTPTPELKVERPALPASVTDKKLIEQNRASWRRQHHDRDSGSNESIERPRSKKKK